MQRATLLNCRLVSSLGARLAGCLASHKSSFTCYRLGMVSPFFLASCNGTVHEFPARSFSQSKSIHLRFTVASPSQSPLVPLPFSSWTPIHATRRIFGLWDSVSQRDQLATRTSRQKSCPSIPSMRRGQSLAFRFL